MRRSLNDRGGSVVVAGHVVENASEPSDEVRERPEYAILAPVRNEQTP